MPDRSDQDPDRSSAVKPWDETAWRGDLESSWQRPRPSPDDLSPLEIDPAKSGHHNWAMLDETLAELRAAGCVDEETVIVADHLSTGNVGPHDTVADEQASRGIILAYDGLRLPL